MQRFLSQFSLKVQIGFIGLIGVLGLIGFGLEYFISDASQTRTQLRAERQAAAHDRLNQIEIDLLQARRAEKDFLLRRTENYLGRHQQVVTAARSDLDALAKLLDGSELSAQIASAVTGVKAYGDQFAKVGASQKALGLNEETGLLGALRKSVRDVEEALKNFDEPRMAVTMLMMRRHEKDFLARLDPKYGEDMKKRAAEFEKQLAGSTIPEAERAPIAAHMAAYQKDFFALLAGQMALVND